MPLPERAPAGLRPPGCPRKPPLAVTPPLDGMRPRLPDTSATLLPPVVAPLDESFCDPSSLRLSPGKEEKERESRTRTRATAIYPRFDSLLDKKKRNGNQEQEQEPLRSILALTLSWIRRKETGIKNENESYCDPSSLRLSWIKERESRTRTTAIRLHFESLLDKKKKKGESRTRARKRATAIPPRCGSLLDKKRNGNQEQERELLQSVLASALSWTRTKGTGVAVSLRLKRW